MIKLFEALVLVGLLTYAAITYWPKPPEAALYPNGVTAANEKPLTETPMGAETAMFQRLSSDKAGVYFWYAPQNPQGKLPIVVVLHGAPGRSYAGSFLVRPNVQAVHPSFILVPTSPNVFWTNKEKMANVVQLINELAGKHPVDTSRIYIIGCSQGGNGVYSAVLDYPQVFAAAIPISGEWNVADAPKFRYVPMWIMNGASDTTIPPDSGRKIAAYAQSVRAPVYYSELPNTGHECPSEKYYGENTWKWLFGQKRQ